MSDKIDKEELEPLVEQWRNMGNGIVPSDSERVRGQSDAFKKCADDLEELIDDE